MLRVLILVLGLLPASRAKNRLLSLLPGWRIAGTARFHPCLVWGVREFRAADGAFVGPLNCFRSMRSVVMGEQSELGQLNWFSGALVNVGVADADRAGTLRLGVGAGVSSRHYVDCSGGFTIGDLAVLGGVRSTVLTHSADLRAGETNAVPVTLGERVVVFTGVIITPGVTVAPRSAVAAGAVVTGDLTQPETLYGGVPAKPVGSTKDAAFMNRAGRLHPRGSLT